MVSMAACSSTARKPSNTRFSRMVITETIVELSREIELEPGSQLPFPASTRRVA